MTFEEWMQQVDSILLDKIFLTSEDIEDQCYMDWFEDGVTPEEASIMTLENSFGPDVFEAL